MLWFQLLGVGGMICDKMAKEDSGNDVLYSSIVKKIYVIASLVSSYTIY